MAHGSHVSKVVAPQSTSYQGPFGRICGELKPWFPNKGLFEHIDPAKFEALKPGDACTPMNEPEVDAWFQAFAAEHMVERVGKRPEDLLEEDTVKELEAEFSTGKEAEPKTTGIPAGYTYFGQFVDHDITFDPASTLVRQNDPNSLSNFRTPRLDLDNLYGRGPHDQPYMFEARHNLPDGASDGEKEAEIARREKLGALSFVIGKVERNLANGDKTVETKFEDLPRGATGRAIIGDMRNDENAIVSQLQLAFLKAHNTLLERALEAGSCTPFDDAQRTLRWLYQWIVWNDFMERIANNDIWKAALKMEPKKHPGGPKWELGLKHVYRWKRQPFMPIEFAVAAYRFGHSMVRNGYRTNTMRGANIGDQAPLFDTTRKGKNDLRGFRPMIEENVIQWDWFLPMESSFEPLGFPQRARKIDTKLSNALANLAEMPNVLAYRNLKRSWSFAMPRGTDVARKYVCDSVIKLEPHEPDNLWYYILKEAESAQGKRGEMLGRLGSTLVCAVFAGLLKGDPQSWINQNPCWTPNDDPLLKPGEDNIDSGDAVWELSSIIRLAKVPTRLEDF